MNNNVEKDLENENCLEQINEIKKLNPNLENDILKAEDSLLKDISNADKKNGAWFPIILKKVLDTHIRNVSYEYFREKYNSSVKDILAKKLIGSACNCSIMTGALLGAGGGIFGLPTAIPATFGEIATLTYFQINMIYDLSLIYGKPIDLNDPEESYKILMLALGIKASEMLNVGIEIGAKQGGRIAVEKAGKRVVLNQAQKLLEVAGVKIAQRTIKNFISKAIPVVGIVLGGCACSILDYQSTKYVAYNALSIYRTDKLIIELFEKSNSIPDGDEKSYDTLIKGCMIIANADDIVDMHKTKLIEHIYECKYLKNNFKERIKIHEKEFFEPFEKIENLEIKKTILFALEMLAACNRQISRKEMKILEKVSLLLGIDKKTLDKDLKNIVLDLFLI